MKFKKKPIIVEAEQWFPGKDIEGLVYKQVLGIKSPYPSIFTLEGEFVVKEGDWIITGVKGEKYPCKVDIFEMTYEKIEE